MRKTLLYRLFGVGRVGSELRRELEDEEIVALDEGIGGWIIERNLRSPSRISFYRVRSFTGFLALTHERIRLYAYGRPQINLPLADPRLSDLHVGLPDPGRIVISLDYGLFREGWRGTAEFRLRTDSASRYYEALLAAGATGAGAGLAASG